MRGAEQVAREQWKGKKRDKRMKKRGGKSRHADEYRRTSWGELRRDGGGRSER